MQKNYLAIDIGASSGRHIVGWMENGVLRTEEVYRFPNSVQRVNGHLKWDIDSLFANVKNGIREAFAKYPAIESLSIDTWAVDYVLLKTISRFIRSTLTATAGRRRSFPKYTASCPLNSFTSAPASSSSPSTAFISCTLTKKPDGWQRPRTF